ncbi:MAG: DsbA family protein [Candidatus Moranbacteria bacterium]|nr:DsbA family protein [Candidatus Moranbacteria bacterium]
MESKKDKKIKNLLSIAILLAGLFVGSLFVDVAQIIKGSGFSSKNLNRAEIFEANGKTWVAYNEPAVGVKVVSDDACEKCDPSEALVWLRRVLPTISAEKVAYDSQAGKDLIGKFGISTLPAFIFDEDITKTDFYTQAQILFDPKDGSFVMKTQELGLEPGKYLNIPETKEGDATFGKLDSDVRVVVFSDFQCPFCKSFWNSLRDTMKSYGDRVAFSYKHLPLGIHPQANNAALAADCALEQGKFWEYGDKLYAAQSAWSQSTGTQAFKNYAQELKLDTERFNQCLDSKKYQDKIDADKNEANAFGISGTPATFINNQFKNGVVSAEELQSAIEAELAG